MCPIVKSVDSHLKDRIHVELDSNVDTRVVGSNVLVLHDHGHNIIVDGYDCTPMHKNITIADAAVAYNDPQTGDTSILLINQAI